MVEVFIGDTTWRVIDANPSGTRVSPDGGRLVDKIWAQQNAYRHCGRQAVNSDKLPDSKRLELGQLTAGLIAFAAGMPKVPASLRDTGAKPER